MLSRNILTSLVVPLILFSVSCASSDASPGNDESKGAAAAPNGKTDVFADSTCDQTADDYQQCIDDGLQPNECLWMFGTDKARQFTSCCESTPAADPSGLCVDFKTDCAAREQDYDLCIEDGLDSSECLTMWGAVSLAKTSICCDAFGDQDPTHAMCDELQAGPRTACGNMADDHAQCSLDRNECVWMWDRDKEERMGVCCQAFGNDDGVSTMCDDFGQECLLVEKDYSQCVDAGTTPSNCFTSWSSSMLEKAMVCCGAFGTQDTTHGMCAAISNGFRVECQGIGSDFSLCLSDGLTQSECIWMWDETKERRMDRCCDAFGLEASTVDMCRGYAEECQAIESDYDQCLDDGLDASECTNMWGPEKAAKIKMCCEAYGDQDPTNTMCP